jgi:GDA1/CD39 (nucleoside phosphatase) family
LLSADVASAEAEEAVDFESFAEEQLVVQDTAEEELTLEDTAGEQMAVESTLEEAEDAEHPHPIQHGSTGGFAVVVDVGTTGTRATLFSWKVLAKHDWLPIVKKLRALRSDNPLKSSSAKSMGMKALSALFKRLRNYLPKGVNHVPVFYASTMSVDPASSAQNAILQQAIATIEAAGFHVVEKKTWSGQEEGMMEYISAQAYAFGEKKPLTRGQMITQNIGTIHTGASSMNVVFHPADGKVLNHHYKMELGSGQELSVYAASFPRFGVNAARDRILSIVALTHAASLQGKAKKQIEQHHKSHSKTPLPAHLLEATKPGVTPSGVLAAFRRANIAAKKPATESALPHPCYPKGLLMKGVSTWAIEGKLDVVGTGNYKACRNLMREIIHRGGVCYTDALPYGPAKTMPTQATPYGFAPEAGFTRIHPSEQSKKAGHSTAEVDVAPSQGSTCSISGTYQPSTKGVSFYAFGSISHAYEALKLSLTSSSLLDFAVAVKRECFASPARHEKGKYIKGKKQTWKDLKAKHPKTPEKHLRNMCADGVYLSTLLLEGLHLDGHHKGVVKVFPSDAHMNWAHGALFSHLVSERLSLAGQQGEHDEPKLPSHTPRPSHTHSPLPVSQTPYPSIPGPGPVGSHSPTPFPSHHRRGSHSPTPFPSPHHPKHASHTHSPLPVSQTPYPSIPGPGPVGSHSPSPLPHSQTPYPTPMAQPGGGVGGGAEHQKAVPHRPKILPGNVGPDREVYSAVKLGEELQRKAQKLLAETTTSSEGGAAAAKTATEADNKEKEGIPARVLRGASTTTKGDDELDVKMTLHWDSIKDGDNGAHTTKRRHHHKKHKKVHHE